MSIVGMVKLIVPKSSTQILVICGPTASGKTSLALNIADSLLHRHSGHDPESSNASLRVSYSNRSNLTPPISVNILSADSRQVYRGLDILTGKDIPSDLPDSIKIFGLDLVSPDQTFNLSDFVTYSQKIILQSIKEGIPLIIVGGTGLYLQAITSPLLNVQVPPNPALRLELEKISVAELRQQLEKIYPSKFSSMNNSDSHNPRRLVRALEIASSSPVGAQHDAPESILPSTPTFRWIALRPPKNLSEKIRERVVSRLNSGAVEEVKNLLQNYPNQKLPIYSSLGVSQIIDYLEEKISRDQLIDLWAKAEIDYAKRQMVWFKKRPELVWQ